MKTFLQIAFVILAPLFLKAQTSNWITISSVYTIEQTVDMLQKTIQQKGFKLFATINHSQEAETAGLKLRPTILLMLGNPKAGTVLMNCNQQIGIDLPLKILVWEESDGQIKAGFINPEIFFKEYKLEDCKDVLPRMKAVLQDLVATVARKN